MHRPRVLVTLSPRFLEQRFPGWLGAETGLALQGGCLWRDSALGSPGGSARRCSSAPGLETAWVCSCSKRSARTMARPCFLCMALGQGHQQSPEVCWDAHPQALPDRWGLKLWVWTGQLDPGALELGSHWAARQASSKGSPRRPKQVEAAGTTCTQGPLLVCPQRHLLCVFWGVPMPGLLLPWDLHLRRHQRVVAVHAPEVLWRMQCRQGTASKKTLVALLEHTHAPPACTCPTRAHLPHLCTSAPPARTYHLHTCTHLPHLHTHVHTFHTCPTCMHLPHLCTPADTCPYLP